MTHAGHSGTPFKYPPYCSFVKPSRPQGTKRFLRGLFRRDKVGPHVPKDKARFFANNIINTTQKIRREIKKGGWQMAEHFSFNLKTKL